jgi:hypothetical protein
MVFRPLSNFHRRLPSLSDSAICRETELTAVRRSLPPVSDFLVAMALEMALDQAVSSTRRFNRRFESQPSQ